jgi:antitoxin FitA
MEASAVATLTIRNLDDGLKSRLRVRAAKNGRSMEEEVRDILRGALATRAGLKQNLAEAIGELFAPVGGVELEPYPDEPMRDRRRRAK